MANSLVIVATWATLVLVGVLAGYALRLAALALRAARTALANAHHHVQGPPQPIVVSTGNGHVTGVVSLDQAPDAEIDETGEAWIKRFGPPESWAPWEDQR